MAIANVSKRLRYEILRRDNYCCRYCGSIAGPDVKLTVDHVLPTALGGSDEPSNLAAACQECNAGKSSTGPDEPLVDDIDARQLAWRGAVAQAAQEIQTVDPETARAIDGMQAKFGRCYTIGPAERDTIAKYIDQGLPAEILIDGAHIAMRNDWVNADEVFRYSIGVARKKLTAIQERAREILAESEAAK